MKIGITANPHIPSALDSAKHVVGRLEPAHEVVLESDLARVFGRGGMPVAQMKADIVLAIGGDGTILRALQLSDAKVLGINSGSLGFLAEVYAEEIDEYLDRIARGDYKVEERMRLKVTVDGERMFDCTNEAVVHTAQVAKIRHFEIRLGEEMVERVRADGVLVAIPTVRRSDEARPGDRPQVFADDLGGVPRHVPPGVRSNPAGRGRHDRGPHPRPGAGQREAPRDLPAPPAPRRLLGRRHGPLPSQRRL